MTSISKIYYIPLGPNGKEQTPCVISIKPDGVADLSRLPKDIQEHLLTFGTPDPLHQNELYPEDGELFLLSLLKNATPYLRFRENI